MEIVAQHSEVHTYDDERTSITWDAGHLFQLAKCPACSDVVLQKGYWHSGTMDVPEYAVLYPSHPIEIPRGLPAAIAQEYLAALKIRSINVNGYGAVLRRILDMICEDREAQGKYLANKINDLAKRGEIPKNLVKVASRLKDLGDIGAHPSLGALTENEIPVLDNLTRAIAEYVYTAPLLVQEAAKQLSRLKSSSDAKPVEPDNSKS
jgi:hypothetical protein